MYYLSNNIIDSSFASILLANVFQNSFLSKSFKVPNLSIVAAQQTILTPISLIVIEHPVLALCQ